MCLPVLRAQRVDLSVFEAAPGALEGDDSGVVEDAVDGGGRDDLIAEDVAPASEGQV